MPFDFQNATLHLQVAKRCNLKCTMCSWETWHTNSGMMDWDLFLQIIADAKKNHIQKIVFGNAQGEPFLHPEILEMITYVKKNGFWLMASTNGTPITRKKADSIARTNIDNIQFSFAGFDKHSYESVYVGGKWQQVSNNLENIAISLKKHKAPTTLTINGCVASNILSFYTPVEYSLKTRSFLYSIGITPDKHNICIQLPHNFAGGKQPDLKKGIAGTQSFYQMNAAPRPCKILETSPGIYSDGKVTACGCLDPNGDMTIGDMKHQKLGDILSGNIYKNMKQAYARQQFDTLPLCRQCDYPFIEKVIDPINEWWRPEYHKESYHKESNNAGSENDRKSAPSISANCNRLFSGISKPTTHPKSPVRFLLEELKACQLPAGKIFEAAVQGKIDHLHIAPCTEFVRNNLEWLQTISPNIHLYDSNLAGAFIGSYEIKKIEHKPTTDLKNQWLLLTTDNIQVDEFYRKSWPALRLVDFDTLLDSYGKQALKAHDTYRIFLMNEFMRKNEKKTILMCQRFTEKQMNILKQHDLGMADTILLSRLPQFEHHFHIKYDPSSSIPLNMILDWPEFIACFDLLTDCTIFFDMDSILNTFPDARKWTLKDTLQQLIRHSKAEIIADMK